MKGEMRYIDLASYLPPFMMEYKEPKAALDAETPEFILIYEAKDRVLYNRFIETADEYGISRYEKMLNILPSEEDTLESRRIRVRNAWFNQIPYNLKVLTSKLIVLCGEDNFTISNTFGENYTLTINTDMELFGQVDELDQIIETIIPSNIYVNAQNIFPCEATGQANFAGGLAWVDVFSVTQDFKENVIVNGLGSVAVAITVTDIIQSRKEGNE